MMLIMYITYNYDRIVFPKISDEFLRKNIFVFLGGFSKI